MRKSLIDARRLNKLIGEVGGVTSFSRLNGIPRQDVYRVLQGEGEFQIKTTLRIAQNANCSIDWLLGRTSERSVRLKVVDGIENTEEPENNVTFDDLLGG